MQCCRDAERWRAVWVATELVGSGAALSVAAAALRQLVADDGAERAAQLWQETGLDLLSFMPSVRLHLHRRPCAATS